MHKLRGQFDIQLCDGTELGCILNMYALGNFLTDNNAELSDLEQMLNSQEKALHFVPDLLWYGVQAFFDLNDAEPTISQKKFRVLFGSSDWEDALKNMMIALELSDGTKKKPVKKAKKK